MYLSKPLPLYGYLLTLTSIYATLGFKYCMSIYHTLIVESVPKFGANEGIINVTVPTDANPSSFLYIGDKKVMFFIHHIVYYYFTPYCAARPRRRRLKCHCELRCTQSKTTATAKPKAVGVRIGTYRKK